MIEEEHIITTSKRKQRKYSPVNFSDERKQKIIAYYIACNNIKETSRKFQISQTTIRKWINEDEEMINKQIEENRKKYRNQFIIESNQAISDGMKIIGKRLAEAANHEELINKAIEDILKEDIPDYEKKAAIKVLSEKSIPSLKELTITVGTLFDKRALSTGEATQNSEVIFKMPDSMKCLAQ